MEVISCEVLVGLYAQWDLDHGLVTANPQAFMDPANRVREHRP